MPKKLLIVDDQPDALEVVALLFRYEGYEVITATDGQQGFEVAIKERPDLILTDLMMPNVDGIDLIRLLRGTPQLRQVPVIVMTAFGDSKLSQCLAAGADEAIRKPLRFDLLLDLTARLISLPR